MSIKSYLKNKIQKTMIVPEKVVVTSDSILSGKRVLIVGGSGGIGSAIAEKCIMSGASVIVTGTKNQTLQEISSRLKCDTYMLDVNRIDAIDQNLKEIVKIYGPLDILVYSAGIHGADAFGSVTEETFDSVMNVNVKGMYFICQAFSNYLISNKRHGHILTIGSASSAKPGWTPYEISKAAVKSLTLGFADKLISHGIVVNSIAPGPVATKMLNRDTDIDIKWECNPSGRMSTPEEIANLAIIMISDAGNMIVGDTYYISGGSGTICTDK